MAVVKQQACEFIVMGAGKISTHKTQNGSL